MGGARHGPISWRGEESAANTNRFYIAIGLAATDPIDLSRGEQFGTAPRQILPIVLASPRVRGRRGRPKELPDELYAGRGYDGEMTRAPLRWPGIEPHIAKRWMPHGSGLGKVRWVVERTIAWLEGCERDTTGWG
jgi:hypothetical protein